MAFDTPTGLRRAAVYWDTIEVPSNTFYDFALPHTGEVRELMAAGVLREEDVYIPRPGLGVPPGLPTISLLPGEDMSAFLVRTQWVLFRHHEGKEPGVWTIAQDGSELAVAEPESEAAHTAEVELHNLLPVPRDNVPIAEILEFKQKRQPALDRLREEIDGLSRDIADRQTVPKAADAAVKKVQAAVSDVFSAMNERFEAKWAGRISISISLETLLHVLGMATNTHIPEWVGISASMISLTLKESRAPKGLIRKGPWGYVYDVMKDIM